MTSRKMTNRKIMSIILTTHQVITSTTPQPRRTRRPRTSRKYGSTSPPQTTLRTDSLPPLRRCEKLLWIILMCKGQVGEGEGRRGQVEVEVSQGHLKVISRMKGSKLGKKRYVPSLHYTSSNPCFARIDMCVSPIFNVKQTCYGSHVMHLPKKRPNIFNESHGMHPRRFTPNSTWHLLQHQNSAINLHKLLHYSSKFIRIR